jgi:short-subunit dehydrogenase
MYVPLRADNFDIQIAEKTIDANLLGPMRAVALVIPDMLKAHSGHIAIVGSVAGYSGLPKALAYGPSKAAIINFCENLYYDLLPTGVSVHMISPGFVATEATAQNDFEMPALISAEEAANEILDGIHKGKFDIHFPKRFSRFLKFLRILPYPIYFWIVRRFVKI